VVGDLPATGLIVGRSLEVSTEDHVLEVQEGFLGRRPAPSVDQARSAPPRHLELGL
jgi:hypothetical protein